VRGMVRATLLCAIVWCGLAQNAEDVPQLFRKALALQQSGDLPGAIKIYEQILKIRPDVPPAHANLGAALAALGRYQQAIGLCDRPALSLARLEKGQTLPRTPLVPDSCQ